jgi:cytochrome P450
MLNVLDPPAHTQLRSVVRPCFMPRHVRALEPIARETVDALLDDAIERGGIDAVSELGGLLSAKMASLAIGLPVEDAPMLVELVQRFFTHDPGREGMTTAGLAALGELTEYCLDRIREARRDPGDQPTALHAIARFAPEGRLFSDEDAASHVTMLVIGGTETFPKTLANGLLRLWQHRDQRKLLIDDPSRIPAAYDEILRFDMPTQFLCRTLVEDYELRGEKMAAGQAVMLLYASANRDELEFDEPDRFDVLRRPQRILSFGAGTHACLGTHVARMEGRVCFERILARVPDYEIVEREAVRLQTEFVQGFASLPIRLS